MSRRLRLHCTAAVVATVVLAFGLAPASAEGVYATGAEWTKSSQGEKLAYLLGISNLMSADYELQRKNGAAGGSAIPKLYAGTSDFTIEQTAAAIDAYFAQNPDMLGDSVLDAIWITLVER